jgi:hypothetical protein
MPAAAMTRDLSRYLPPLVTDPRRKAINLLTVSTEEPRHDGKPSCHSNLADKVAEIIEIPCNPSTVWLDEMLKPEFFRGLQWTELPVASDPWYRVGLGRINPAKGIGDKVGVAEFFEAHYAYLHYDAREVWDATVVARDRYRSGYIHSKMFGDNGHLHVATRKSNDILSMTAAEMMEPAGGSMRLEYSYRFNMKAIAGKLVEEISLNAPSRRQVLKPSMYGSDFLAGASVSDFYHPLALQLLYSLKRSGPVSAQSFSYGRPPLDELYVRDDRETFWGGTGKHAPVRIREGSDEARAERSLFLLGFAEQSDNRNWFHISEAGERFLGRIHPDCEDPDVLNRWADVETGLIAGCHKDKVDSWLVRFFRKLKTRVNEDGKQG